MGDHNIEPPIFVCNLVGFLNKTKISVGARAPTAPTPTTPLLNQKFAITFASKCMSYVLKYVLRMYPSDFISKIQLASRSH